MGVMTDLFKDYRDAHLALRDAETLLETKKCAWETGCAEVAKCDVQDLEFTNIYCSSSMTFSCVYKWKTASGTKGIGHRICIFCKNDDFDF